jgi:hypothetical protein
VIGWPTDLLATASGCRCGFGQRTATAWADNAAFAQNARNLSGSSALIGTRHAGATRAFELVQQIRLGADAGTAGAELLQQRLDRPQQLAELAQPPRATARCRQVGAGAGALRDEAAHPHSCECA